MSEDNQGQEKSEQPTQRRLDKAREDGQVPRSKELTTTAILLFSSLAFLFFGDFLADKLMAVIKHNFSIPREAIFDSSQMIAFLVRSFADVLIGLAPFFILLLLAAIVGPIALGGWLFSAKSLQPKFNRLNPIEGIKRMFSMKSLVELGKAIAKVLLIFCLAILLLAMLEEDLKALAREDLVNAIKHSALIAAWVTLGLSLATILIALIDVPFQIYDHTKKLKMSVQDIKDEMKDTDGKPEVKGRIRQLQMEMANRRMMSDVPEADVVITNPTHFSIAIKYRPKEMQTPIVVAKGVDQVALKIREIAAAHQVEIVQSPVLARAIYHTTALNEEIPSDLYVAVAKVLAYVFQLRNFRNGSGERPGFPHNISVPDDMKY